MFRFISETIQYVAIVTMENEYELACDLSNGAILYDIARFVVAYFVVIK